MKQPRGFEGGKEEGEKNLWWAKLETPTQTKIDSRDLKDVKRADLNPMELTSFFSFQLQLLEEEEEEKR